MSYPINPLILANSQGIPRLEATRVNVAATEVQFVFQNQAFLNTPFIGLILFKLPLIPAGTTDTLPVVFTANGSNQAAINYNTGVATAVAVMAVAQAVTAMKMMTMMRTTTSVEVYPALVDMVVVDTVEDAATNN